MEKDSNKEKVRSSRFSRFVGIFVRIVAVVSFLVYALSILAFYMSPAVIGPLSILGLFYWPALILYLVSAIFLILRKEWKWLLIYSLGLFLSVGNITSLFSFGIGVNTSANASFSIYTNNVHLLGYYDGKDSKVNREKYLQNIFNSNADIICLQECYWKEGSGSFFFWKNEEKLSGYNVCERATHTLSDGSHFGVILMTKFPIRFQGTVPFENDVNNFAIYADIETPNGMIRVYSVHLQSFRLKERHLKLFDEEIGVGEIQNNSKPLFVQLYRATLKRSKQVERLSKSIEESPYPVFVCGDFNDVPSSNSYFRLTRALQDAFLASNDGVGATYNGPFPGMRIDYILHDEKFGVNTFEKIEIPFGDHDALFAEFGLK
jgi:endonuclease/exonuclease/phosphatase family metal-dependent hydrolase